MINEVYICPIKGCKYETPFKSRMNHHNRFSCHKGFNARIYAYFCTSCKKPIRQRTNLRSHAKTKNHQNNKMKGIILRVDMMVVFKTLNCKRKMIAFTKASNYQRLRSNYSVKKSDLADFFLEPESDFFLC